MIKKYLEKIYLALIFILLYAPILTLIVLSFNNSKTRAKWGGFTLKWYSRLFQNEQIMNALYTTLIISLLAAVIATVIGTAAAIVYPMDNITNFLYLIGSVFAPMIAVQIADYFILKKADAGKSAFQWRNLIVWLAGFIIYRILMHVDTPLGNTLPDMVITVVLCLIVEKAAGAVKSK